MEPLRYAALALLLTIGLSACSSSPDVPATAARALPGAPDDQVARGVGNLRRLAALPVVIEQGSCAWPEVARDLDESSIRFLRDWKGFELVRPPQPDPSWKLAGKLGEWQEGDVGKGKPPSELRAQVVAIGKDSGVDGILVIHASPECPGGADAGLLTLPARLAESLNRTLSAGVYEAERGTLVWHRHIRPPGWDPARYGSRPPPRFETRQAAEALLGPIENAVPAVLRPPRAPPKPAPEPEPPATVVTPAREATPLVPVPTTPVPDATTPAATVPGTTPAPPAAAAAPPAPAPVAEPPAPANGPVPQLPAPEAPAAPKPPEAAAPAPASAPPAAPVRI